MNRAEEDYIKTIYELTIEKNQSLIKTNELSERFGFTDQSVNEMIKRLEQKKLISFIPYKGVFLTNKGKEVAIRMIRSHRIWEVFLTEKLGFPWESVHEDAEMLEHAASPLVLEKLYDYLGKPKYCQHGNPIPDLEGKMDETTHLSLDETSPHDVFEVLRVLDHKDLLTYMNQQNMRLHDRYLIIEKDPFTGLIKIEKDQEIKTLSLKIAKMIFGQIVIS